ncbi:MAG: HEXXH motif-containing putative peptide modification protein [Pseudomonadota bacterium]
MTSTDFNFFPSASRADALLIDMHRSLYRSLLHIQSAASEAGHPLSEELEEPILRLQKGDRLDAMAFADYNQMVDAIIEDRYDDAHKFAKQIKAVPAASSDLRILRFEDPKSDALSGSFASQIDLEYYGIAPVSEADSSEYARRVKIGFDTLATVDEGLSDEVRILVNTVMIAAENLEQPSEVSFGGGSIFSMPGLLFLNVNQPSERLDMIEVLAHESAHSLLFGFCIDEPFTKNDPNATYQSPLRRDPRPMEGIYHATFVSARMSYAMDIAAQSEVLTQDERAAAKEMAEADAKHFYNGLDEINEQGELSETGVALLQGAKSFMDARKAA